MEQTHVGIKTIQKSCMVSELGLMILTNQIEKCDAILAGEKASDRADITKYHVERISRHVFGSGFDRNTLETNSLEVKRRDTDAESSFPVSEQIVLRTIQPTFPDVQTCKVVSPITPSAYGSLIAQ